MFGEAMQKCFELLGQESFDECKGGGNEPLLFTTVILVYVKQQGIDAGQYEL